MARLDVEAGVTEERDLHRTSTLAGAMDCRDRFAVWLVELVLEPVRALRENGGGSATVRTALGERRFDVTIAREGADYRWSLREVGGPLRGIGGRAAGGPRGCVLGRVDCHRGGGVRIAIVLFDGAEELDWAGPWEVLAAWSRMWPEDDVEVYTVADSLDADHVRQGPARAGGAHLGDRRRRPTSSSGPAARARATSSASKPCGSACAALARDRRADDERLHGLARLRRRGPPRRPPATTYWGALDRLGELGKDIRGRRESRFVDDGDVVTAAGVSAGIDMALHLVARLHSEDRAREVRRYIQYDPEPPV